MTEFMDMSLDFVKTVYFPYNAFFYPDSFNNELEY